jgi:hypothetical protein
MLWPTSTTRAAPVAARSAVTAAWIGSAYRSIEPNTGCRLIVATLQSASRPLPSSGFHTARLQT